MAENIFIDFKYMSPGSGFKTGLGNWHTLEEVIHTGQLVDYLTRSDKCLVFDNNETSDELRFKTNKEKLNFLKAHLKENSKLTSSGIYNVFDEKPLDLDISKIKNNLKNLNQTVWEMTVSPSGEHLSLKYNFLTKDKWHIALKQNFQKLLKTNKLNPKNINAHYVLHGNTSNPHLHLFFYEKNPTRRKGNFSIESLKNFSFKFKLAIENNDVYEQIKSLTKNIWDTRKELNKILYENVKTNANSRYEKYRDFFIASSEILKELNGKKNISYKKLSDEGKLNIEKIKNFLIDIGDNDYSIVYKHYQKQIDELENLKITDKYLIQRINKTIKRELEEFEVQSGNRIIKALLTSTKNSKKQQIPKTFNKAANFLLKFINSLDLPKEQNRLIKLAERQFMAESIEDLQFVEEYFRKKWTK